MSSDEFISQYRPPDICSKAVQLQFCRLMRTNCFICLSECRHTIRFGVLMTIVYIRTRLIVVAESISKVG